MQCASLVAIKQLLMPAIAVGVQLTPVDHPPLQSWLFHNGVNMRVQSLPVFWKSFRSALLLLNAPSPSGLAETFTEPLSVLAALPPHPWRLSEKRLHLNVVAALGRIL